MAIEDIDKQLELAEAEMEQAINHLQQELIKIRAGKASPAMLNGLFVDYYGAPTPLNQVANVSNADARTLVIQPWEKSTLANIEQSIFSANLGVTPMNDGEVVRIVVPPLTEERRKDLVKQAKGESEQAKVSLRSARHKALDAIKAAVKEGYPEDMAKRLEAKVGDMIAEYTKKIDKLIELKEKDILTV